MATSIWSSPFHLPVSSSVVDLVYRLLAWEIPPGRGISCLRSPVVVIGSQVAVCGRFDVALAGYFDGVHTRDSVWAKELNFGKRRLLACYKLDCGTGGFFPTKCRPHVRVQAANGLPPQILEARASRASHPIGELRCLVRA